MSGQGRGKIHTSYRRRRTAEKMDENQDKTIFRAQFFFSLPLDWLSEWIFRLFVHISIFSGFPLFCFCLFFKKQCHLFNENVAHQQHASSFSICGCWVNWLLQSRDKLLL